MSKAFVVLLLLYGVFLYAMSFGVTRAYFTDSTTSMNNTFIAANEFPATSPTDTPTPTLTGTPTATPSPTPENIANHIVISEVQIATPGATLSDFIELYNPTSSPIGLSGHRLVKRTGNSADTSIKVFDSTDTIPAHGYYLWASSDGGYASQINANVDTGENISSGDSIAIRQGDLNTGTIIDQVAWGTQTGTPLIEGSGFGTNPDPGQSIERKALSSSDVTSMMSGGDVSKGNGYDSNNNATDFILRTVSQPQHSGSVAEFL